MKGLAMLPPHKFGNMDEGPIEIPEADVSHIQRKWLDLPYASTSASQMLDIYLPAKGEGPFPVVLHIHGGAFAIGDKRDIHVLPFLFGVERGYAVVSVNYRLSGEAIFPAGLWDLKAALRWLRSNADQYHLDGTKIAACGGSAGGYYSVMLGLTANVTALEDLSLGYPEQSCDVQAVVDWYGPTDFLKMDEQLAESGLEPTDHNDPQSPESRLLGAQITTIPAKVKMTNPLTYIHKDIPPLWIQHGRKDHLVPFQQSVIFVRELERRLGPGRCEFEILDQADHADPLFETDENLERVFAFLDKNLR
jgi:acetyl esterase/lipase